MSKPFETELISSSFDETYKTLVKQYQAQKAVNDLQEQHLTALDGEIERVDERIDSENAERVAEVARLDDRIDTEHAERVAEIERVETESADTFQTKSITPVVVASEIYNTVDSAITAIADNMASGSVTRAELDTEVNTLNDRIDTEVTTLNGTITTSTDTLEAEKQNKTLDNPLPLPLGTQTDVEGALGGLSVQEQIDTGNLSNSIAQDFNGSASYAVGDYVMKDKLLHKCVTAHQGEWVDADFALVKVVDEMGGGSPSPTPATELYDYVITNQAEFDDWQQNHNDGTETVAILAGTYTCSAQEGQAYAILQPKELKGFGEVEINCTATYGVKGENDNSKKIENITVNCTGTVTGGYGFRGCNNLTNCTGIGTGGTQGDVQESGGYGFKQCACLTACIGTGESKTNNVNSIGRGFDTCSYMTQCQGQGLRGQNGSGKAFGNCTAMTYCKASRHCTDEVATVSSCSSSPTYNATYQVANTLNGGWNDLTNPA